MREGGREGRRVGKREGRRMGGGEEGGGGGGGERRPPPPSIPLTWRILHHQLINSIRQRLVLLTVQNSPIHANHIGVWSQLRQQLGLCLHCLYDEMVITFVVFYGKLVLSDYVLR